MNFGEALRAARVKAGMSLQQLGDIVGRTRSALSAIETGRIGVERSPELVSQLEVALQLPYGALAQYLPDGHPARRMADVAVQVVGYIVTDQSPSPSIVLRELLRVSDRLLGSLALQVIGNGLAQHGILDGDYLFYRKVLPGEKAKPGAKLLLRTKSRRRFQLVECCDAVDGEPVYKPLLPDDSPEKAGEVTGLVIAVMRLYHSASTEYLDKDTISVN